MPKTPRLPGAPPVALTMAGSDSSAGAGIQADLKTFSALGAYGITAVTAVVAETPARVARVCLVEAELVLEQICVLAESYPIAAAKTGMLGGRPQIDAIAEGWKPLAMRGVPLVVDPVMAAGSGSRLLDADAMEVLTSTLFPLARLITPNLDEASALLGRTIEDRADMEAAAEELARRHGCAVLLKGGHLGGGAVPDVLHQDGVRNWFEGERVGDVLTHGTGCAYSAAITAGLCHGLALVEAVGRAKRFISTAIAEHFRWEHQGRRVEALNHGAGKGAP